MVVVRRERGLLVRLVGVDDVMFVCWRRTPLCAARCVITTAHEPVHGIGQ